MSLGEAERPERTECRPLEPDPDNAGVGNGSRPYPSGMRFFVFMRLIVNGEELDISYVETLQELLQGLKIDPRRVVVEINLSIVRKADYPTFRLNDGDKVEIVNFVGGG